MTDKKLKPCPICEKPAERNGRAVVGGVKCSTPGHLVQIYGASQENADKLWNSIPRPSQPLPADAVEACARALEEMTPLVFGSPYNNGFQAAQKAGAAKIRAQPPQPEKSDSEIIADMVDYWHSDFRGNLLDEFMTGLLAIVRRPQPDNAERHIAGGDIITDDDTPITAKSASETMKRFRPYDNAERLAAALRALIPADVHLFNSNVPDDAIIPVDMVLGELREAGLAIKAHEQRGDAG